MYASNCSLLGAHGFSSPSDQFALFENFIFLLLSRIRLQDDPNRTGADGAVVTRLTVQPPNIKFGEMKKYQLEVRQQRGWLCCAVCASAV